MYRIFAIKFFFIKFYVFFVIFFKFNNILVEILAFKEHFHKFEYVRIISIINVYGFLFNVIMDNIRSKRVTCFLHFSEKVL